MTSKGFTLVELLVVLAIVAIILSFAIPALRHAFPGLEAKTVSQQIATAMRHTRTQAIRENRDAVFIVDVDRRTYRTDSGPPQRIDEETTVSLVTAATELDGSGIGNIRFFPDGTSTGGRITLQNAHRSFEISVDWLTGRIRLVE
ncbi:MAG: GspH/FimT family pseudopilin [Minwuiales bacterium]|nr:GspH/FimT family pseudopilin [Minwuiales bacterium]